MKGQNIEIDYLDAALHVNLDDLANSLNNLLKKNARHDPVLIIGTQCHPDMVNMAAAYGGRVVQARNCIEMLLGPRMAQLDAQAKTFYLTNGWLENWQRIFVKGLNWDRIEARQNFGYYDRIVLLDTGLTPVDEEKLLEFYDYAQVPVEIIAIDLDYFRKLLGSVK